MSLITQLSEIPFCRQPCGLTIGMFDGVHRGHQALLTLLRAQLPSQSPLVVFSFSQHPSLTLSPSCPVPLIYPPEQKAHHLFELGADMLILVPFSLDLALLSYDSFLSFLKERLRFEWLVLGQGATLGKERQGDATHVQQLGQGLGFSCTYLPPLSFQGDPISSSRIRSLIQQGDLVQAGALLGRRYSLRGQLLREQDRLFFSSPHLCLPPEGEYSLYLSSTPKAPPLSTIALSRPQEGRLYLQAALQPDPTAFYTLSFA